MAFCYFTRVSKGVKDSGVLGARGGGGVGMQIPRPEAALITEP